MITYVNTVFVNNTNNGAVVATKPTTADKDKFVFYDVDKGTYVSTLSDANKRIKIGLVTDKVINKIDVKTGAASQLPVIKWSNIINKDDIKSFASGKPNDITSSEDTVEVNFAGLSADTLQLFNEGKSRIVIRLTFKDLPTRFRKWTESYEYVPKSDDTKDTIAEERKKAKLIRNNPDWADVLLQAESHPFFKGSVSFLIPNDNSINGFIHNFEMAKLLFDANEYHPNTKVIAIFC